jgi:hypothetical protein
MFTEKCIDYLEKRSLFFCKRQQKSICVIGKKRLVELLPTDSIVKARWQQKGKSAGKNQQNGSSGPGPVTARVLPTAPRGVSWTVWTRGRLRACTAHRQELVYKHLEYVIQTSKKAGHTTHDLFH